RRTPHPFPTRRSSDLASIGTQSLRLPVLTPLTLMKLPREFYTRTDVLEVARDLLGTKLVMPARNGACVAGLIVETEAYRGPEDRASHAYGGRRTNRTE